MLNAKLEVRNQGLNILLKGFGHLFVPTLISRRLAGLTTVEVVLSALTTQELAFGAHGESLGYGLTCLLLHSGIDFNTLLTANDGRDVSALTFDFLFYIEFERFL